MELGMKKWFWSVFFLYCVTAVAILLLGRTPDTALSVRDYFVLKANPVPFRTMCRYVSFLLARRDFYSFSLFISNVGGNLLLFLPMGFLLPVLFSEMRICGRCFAALALTVLSAELLQGFLRVGIPDADDLLLNLAGGRIGFLLSQKLNFCGRTVS